MADPHNPTATQRAALVLLVRADGHGHVGSTTQASESGAVQIHGGTAAALERMGFATVTYPRVALTHRGLTVAVVYRDRARQEASS